MLGKMLCRLNNAIYFIDGMSQKTVILTIVLFALIVIGMFTYASLKKSEVKASTATDILKSIAA